MNNKKQDECVDLKKNAPDFGNSLKASAKMRPMKAFGLFAAGAAFSAVSLATFSDILTAEAAQAPRLMAPTLSGEAPVSFADLVERVSPAVVSIHVEREIEVRRNGRTPMDQFGFPFRFGPDGLERGEVEEGDEPAIRRAAAAGSGFFVDDQGHVVTNYHVIEDAAEIKVRLNDGADLLAEIVGTDKDTDLAVLKVKAPTGQAFVPFADPQDLRVGDWVVAVGNPFGLGGTVTSGIVSALGRNNNYGNYNDFIQIDAPINQGNSGGPTFDLQGRVVGVNTAIYSPSGVNIGIGFAIPSDVAQDVVTQLIDKGEVVRGWLGVSIRDLDTTMAAALELKKAEGALVANVNSNTPAAKAGYQEGDVVLSFNGKPVTDAQDLTRIVGSVEPGKTVESEVFRNGKKRSLKVTLGTRTQSEVNRLMGAKTEAEPEVTKEDTEKFGVTFSDLDDDLRKTYRLEKGTKGVLILDVEEGSAAAEAGLVPGLVIIKADGSPISSTEDLMKKIKAAEAKKKQAILLRVQKGAYRDFRALPLED